MTWELAGRGGTARSQTVTVRILYLGLYRPLVAMKRACVDPDWHLEFDAAPIGGTTVCGRAGRAYGLRATPQNPSNSAGEPDGLGSGRHRGVETTPGSCSSRPSKKRAICSGLRRV